MHRNESLRCILEFWQRKSIALMIISVMIGPTNCFPDGWGKLWKLEVEVEVSDQKSICPDRPIGNMSMSRPSQTECANVKTFVRPKWILRSFCSQKGLCPDFYALRIVYTQTFEHYEPKIMHSKIKLSCVYVQTIVPSKLSISRLSCAQKIVNSKTMTFYYFYRILKELSQLDQTWYQ